MRETEAWPLSATDLAHLRTCVDLAREALADGDEPFGSVLVDAAGDVRFADRNRVKDGDETRHPEFEIAKWSAEHLTADERAAATVYTSGEHCPMCSAAHAWMGLGRIVYAVSSATLSGWLAEWGVRAGSGAAAADQRGGTRRTRRRAGAGARGRDEGAAPAALRLTQPGPASRSSKKSSTRSTPSCWRCSVRVAWPLPSNSTAMKSSPSSWCRVAKRVPVALSAAYRSPSTGQPAAARRLTTSRSAGESPRSAPPSCDRSRTAGWLRDHRGHHGRVDHHRQGEAAGEAHPDRAHAGTTDVRVQVARQRAQPDRHRAGPAGRHAS